jgi:hypothetical protein
MDERIEKAFAVANHMATLSNQRRIILEEFAQKRVYYVNGGTFNITPELINFTKTTLDLGYTTDVAFADANNFPIVISDVKSFLDTIVGIYYEALNEYSAKFADLKAKRRIKDIIDL